MTAVEVAVEVMVWVELVRGGALEWLWVWCDGWCIVFMIGETFEAVWCEVVDVAFDVLEYELGFEPVEVLGLLLVVVDLRIG